MEIKYEIPDDKVRSFTGSAKRRLQEQAQKYTLEIISEAEKVEELIREKEKFKNCICSSFSRNIIIYFWPNVLARNVCYDRWRSKYGIPCGLLTCDTDSFYSNDCYILYGG